MDGIYLNIMTFKLWNWVKFKACLMSILMALTLFVLSQITLVVGAGLGGYVSEKLISSTSASNSRLIVGLPNTNSELDIILGDIEGYVSPYMDANSGAFRLTEIIPLVMMGGLLLLLLRMMANSKFNIYMLLVAAILIYVFYAFLPSIQSAINGLIGG